MGRVGNHLILISILAAAIALGASRLACASVVVCGRTLLSCSDSLPGEEAGLLMESPLAAGDWGEFVTHAAELPQLAIELPADKAAPANPFLEAHRYHLRPASGMVPASSSSHSDGTGASGPPLAHGRIVLPPYGLQTCLLPESRTVLPHGPVFRWFRPPRVES